MQFKKNYVQNKVKTSVGDPANPKNARTKQSMKDECDINRIIKRFQKTGQLPNLIKQNPQYGNFSDPLDFQESLNKVNFAMEQFNALPSQVRNRFQNDPAQFLEFATNPANLKEMVKMKLAVPNNVTNGDNAGQQQAAPTKGETQTQQAQG